MSCWSGYAVSRVQVDEEKKLVMAHAGITPQWDLQTAKELRPRC